MPDPLADAIVNKAPSPWTKAQTIGPAQVGDRYVMPEHPENWSISDLLSKVVGPGRPQSVAKDDPYGIQAWSEGKGRMPAMPLTSIYKNAADRAVGTKAFQDTARELNPAIGDAADWLAQRYPRVAAHMRISPETNRIPYYATAGAHIPKSGVITEPIDMSFSKMGLEQMTRNPDAARDAMAHEATHVAQRLGNSDFNPLYDAATELGGYKRNPFEVTAENRGLSAQLGRDKVGRSGRELRFNPNRSPVPGDMLETVPRLLQRHVDVQPVNPASDVIRAILERRLK